MAQVNVANVPPVNFLVAGSPCDACKRLDNPWTCQHVCDALKDPEQIAQLVCDAGNVGSITDKVQNANPDLGGFLLLEQLCKKEKTRAVVVSPSSLLSAMGTTSLAMDDVARRDIYRTFACAKSNEYAALAAAAVVNSCNSIWFIGIAQNDPLVRTFIERASNRYQATVGFNPTAQRINGWVSVKTYGMIDEIISDENIPRKGMLVVNALAFECKWKTQFDKSLTIDSFPFNGGAIRCRMMQRPYATVNGIFTEDGFGCVLDLVLSNEDLAAQYKLRVVLAMRRDGKMPSESFVRRVARSPRTYYDNEYCESLYDTHELQCLAIPVTYASFGPKNITDDLGLKEALETGHVIFDRDVQMDCIIHCAKFKFDELGAKGASATMVGRRESAGLENEERSMIYDKPFFAGLAIYERGTTDPVTFPFAAFITDPSKDKF